MRLASAIRRFVEKLVHPPTNPLIVQVEVNADAVEQAVDRLEKTIDRMDDNFSILVRGMRGDRPRAKKKGKA